MHVLTLSTYPVALPRHGGQQRLHHIAAAYRAANFTVQSVGVLGSPRYPPEVGFVAFPEIERLSRSLANPLLMEDWAIGRLAATDDELYQSLCAQIDGDPDFIHVEQPWLFAFAETYARERTGNRARLVYGSANVEHELKRRILTGLQRSADADALAELVLACEVEAAAHADLVVATSQSDLNWLRARARAEVILAPNGVPERVTTVHGMMEASEITQHAKYVLYCASDHPPNARGFFDMLERGLGCLAPDQRIVVAGGAGASIMADARFAQTPGLASRYIDAGEVTEECLQGLLEACHAVVLPITQGGGTNLKTAEALWAGRWVVATTVAMRGFEQFSARRGLHVCTDHAGFRAAIRTVMQCPPLRLDAPELRARQSLLWRSTLQLLPERLYALQGAQS
jgi:glycosyltransferase involved in cell wall biosynthesis